MTKEGLERLRGEGRSEQPARADELGKGWERVDVDGKVGEVLLRTRDQ